jgi:ABC-type transport system involved in cytochrome c biogenesis permease subunit
MTLEQIEPVFSTVAFALLIVALIVQIIFLIINNKKPDPVSHFILIASFLLLLINTILRSIMINFVAVTNTFEALILFSQSILIVLVVYRLIFRKKANPFIILGGALISVILLAIASSPLIPKDANPPIPALQSYWLVLHVIFAFIGEAFFAVAFVSSIYYLAVRDPDKKKQADKLSYTTIIIGYLLYTAGGLIFGAIWAYYAWGRFWGWDPKETWALITFLVYTIYLHLRLLGVIPKEKRKTVCAIVSIVGFLFALFTFFGVNFLLSGLHSYT